MQSSFIIKYWRRDLFTSYSKYCRGKVQRTLVRYVLLKTVMVRLHFTRQPKVVTWNAWSFSQCKYLIRCLAWTTQAWHPQLMPPGWVLLVNSPLNAVRLTLAMATSYLRVLLRHPVATLDQNVVILAAFRSLRRTFDTTDSFCTRRDSRYFIRYDV